MHIIKQGITKLKEYEKKVSLYFQPLSKNLTHNFQTRQILKSIDIFSALCIYLHVCVFVLFFAILFLPFMLYFNYLFMCYCLTISFTSQCHIKYKRAVVPYLFEYNTHLCITRTLIFLVKIGIKIFFSLFWACIAYL